MKLKNVALVAALLFSAALPAQANECYRAFNQGDFRSAVSTCTSQINSGQYQGASQGHLFTTRGRAYWSLGEYDKALADLNRAVRLLSDNPAAWNNRCALLNQLRRYDQALEDCNRALELNPRYHLAYSNRGAVWRGKRLLQRALVDHNQAIRLYPRRDLYFFRRGRVYMDLKNYDAAIGDFYKAIGLNPRNHRAYFQRGRAWKLKGKLEWALWDFNKCLQINPRVYNAYYHRAVIYQQKGDRTRAIADLERYLQLRPEDEEVKGLLARLKGKPAPTPKATPPAGPIKPPAPARSLTVGRGWRLSVRRSLGIKGVILTQGRQVNLDSLADLAFLARVTRAADGRVEAFECRVNRAVSKELDPQSGQVKQSALAAPGQHLSVNLASGRAQVRDLGSNQPVANEDLRDLLGWPLPLVLWPHRNLRPGMRWTISGPRLVKLLSFLDLTAGRLEMSVQQVARDPNGFTVARLAGRLTASLKLEQVPVRLDA